MDIFETTKKVIENSIVARDSLTVLKVDLNQYEDRVSQLNTIVQDPKCKILQDEEISEDNVTGILENDDSKKTKVLFRKIYGYVQQLEDNLSSISESVNSLQNNENEQKFHNVESTFSDTLEIIKVMKKDVKDKFLNSMSTEIPEKVNVECETHSWESVTDQKDKKDNQKLYFLKLETEQLEDKIEKELQNLGTLIREQKDYNRKLLEFIKSDSKINNTMVQVEENLIRLSEELKDAVKQQPVAQKILEELFTIRCSTAESETQTEKKKKSIENMLKKNEPTKSILNITENKLVACKSKTNQINKEIEEIAALQTTLDEKLILFQQEIIQMEKASFECNLDKILKDHEDLLKNSEKLLVMISENENKIMQQQEQNLQINPHFEILDLSEKVHKMKEETDKNIQLKWEIEQLELRNNSLEENIKSYESIIRDMTAHKKKMQRIREDNKKALKMLALNCDAAVVKPRLVKSPQLARRKVVRSPNFQLKKFKPNKMDFESSSSIETDSFTSTELTKKKILKQLKKHRRCIACRLQEAQQAGISSKVKHGSCIL